MMKWLSENWWWITVALVVLVQVANAVTKHWSEHKGVAKVAAFIAEMLAIVVSAGAKVPGTPSKLKLPLQSVPPEAIEVETARKRAALKDAMKVGIVAIIVLGGCAGWQATTAKALDAVHRGGVAAHDLARNVCRPALEKCKAEKLAAGKSGHYVCPALLSCQKMRKPVLQSLDTLQRSVLLGRIAITVADKPRAAEALQAALQAMELVYSGLKTWGVSL